MVRSSSCNSKNQKTAAQCLSRNTGGTSARHGPSTPRRQDILNGSLTVIVRWIILLNHQFLKSLWLIRGSGGKLLSSYPKCTHFESLRKKIDLWTESLGLPFKGKLHVFIILALSLSDIFKKNITTDRKIEGHCQNVLKTQGVEIDVLLSEIAR